MIEKIVSRIFKPNIEKLKARWDVDGLIKALNHRDYKIRSKAAEALGDMKAKEAVYALIKALKDENPEVRKSASYALGRIGDERAIMPLVEALKDESLDVKIASAISVLDELVNDPNTPIHGRTAIWNIMGALESLTAK